MRNLMTSFIIDSEGDYLPGWASVVKTLMTTIEFLG
jgi:hypothetical protein